MSTTREIREKSNVDLCAQKERLRREIFTLKSTQAPEKKDALHAKVRDCKKEIARIETVLRERQIEEFFTELANIESALG